MLVRLVQPSNAAVPIEVTGKPLYVLGISKDPLADSRQSETMYPLLSAFREKVRSASEAACKDATNNGNMSRLSNFIRLSKEIFTLRSTRNNCGEGGIRILFLAIMKSLPKRETA